MEIEQSASINENSDEEIPKENDERKEFKKERNREYQRAWRQRNKDLRKKKKDSKEDKRNDLQMKRRKWDSNEDEDNVVQCRATQNFENVQLEQILAQQLRIYGESHECITPKVILHRNTDIPGDGNCLFHSLIRVLQLQISTCDLRRQLRDSPHLNSCHNAQEAYNILSSDNEYGDLDCLYLFAKIYNQNICVHFHYFNVFSKNEDTSFCHFEANDTHNWIHLDLRELHFTPYLSDDEKKKEDEIKQKQKREKNKEYSKRYRDKKRTSNLQTGPSTRDVLDVQLDDLQMKKRKLDSNEDQENVVQRRATQNFENVQLEQILAQQLRIYGESHECITPKVILHRSTDIPGDGNCLFHSLIRVLQLQISTCDLRRQLRDSPHLNSCHNAQEAYNILSSDNEYGDLDCLYLFAKIYNQNICVHFHYFNVFSKNEDTRFCHFEANDTHNWIHLDLRELHFTPYLSDDEKKKEDEIKQKQKREKNKEYSKRYRDKQRTSNLQTGPSTRDVLDVQLDDLQMKRRKWDSNEDQDNVVQCSASQNLENVQLEQNQFLTQKLRIYEESHECITPKNILHRNTDIPGDGNCLFHSLIRVLQLQISTCDLRRQLRDSPHLNSCYNPQECYKILSSNNEYGDLDCLYLFAKIYNQNICVHFHYFNGISKNENTRFCHFEANDTHNWIHLDLRELHFTPYFSDDEKKKERERKQKQKNKEYSKRYRDKKRTSNLQTGPSARDVLDVQLDDLQMKRRKLDSNEDQENVVQCRATQNFEHVQLEQNQVLTQQLRINGESQQCITPKAILHRNTCIPGDAEPKSPYCCAFGCSNTERKHPGKVFYEVPEQLWLRYKWLEQVKRLDLVETLASGSELVRVCSDHFPADQYNKKGALKTDAMPTLIRNSEQIPQLKKPPQRKRKQNEEDISTRKQIPQQKRKQNEEDIPTPSKQPCIKIEPDWEEQNSDPLDIKSEHGIRSVASQTFSRAELFYSSACLTETEQIDIPGGSRKPVATTVAVQTPKELVACFVNPLRKQLQAEIREANKKIKKLTNAGMDKNRFMHCCETYLNEKIADIVKTHSHIQDKFTGNRYGHDFKVFALNLYLSNPETYKFFQQIFTVPSKNALRRLQIPPRTGTNPNLIEYLKVKVNNMTEKEKLCALCFDVMRVGKNLWYEVNNDFLCGMQEIDQELGPDPAEYAAVLMVRGLYTKWKQPVSFSFMSEKRRYPELKEWLHKILGMMFDIGLNIKVLVADQGTEFLDVRLPDGEHFFEFEFRGRQIYHFYDMRYLFKSARDSLMEYNFVIGSKVAKWDHILKVYDTDTNHALSLMPKITNEHVRPHLASINDVNLAIQVFSNPVAAAMNFHVIAKKADEETKDTVELIAKMSNIYELFSSRTTARAYRGTDEQNKLLNEMLEYLQNVVVWDKGNEFYVEANFIKGLIVNIKTAMSLLQELKEDNHQYLLTKNLSKDCLEDFFDECRRLGGNCCERPTPIMFARSFRRLFLNRAVNTDQNDQDLKSTLYKISEIMQTDAEMKEDPEHETMRQILGKGVGDFRIQWPSTEYITGYLMWKCLEKHQCAKFIERLGKDYQPMATDGATLLLQFRRYNADNVNSTSLLKPPKYFVKFVDLMDEKFVLYYNRPDRDPMNFCWNTYKSMEEDSFKMPCECFPLKFMKMLFIRLRVEHNIREHNKLSKNPRKPKSQQAKKQTGRKSK